MNKFFIIGFLLFTINCICQDNQRIMQVRNNIEAIAPDSPGLLEKVDIKIKESSLSDFLIAVSEVHKVNISVAAPLKQINIVNNFTDVTVADLLVFLCKQYDLTITFTGNILSVSSYESPKEIPAEKIIDLGYNHENDLLSLNLKDDKLYDAFKKIMDVSGKNLVFAPGMENMPLTAYIKNMPFDAAINKLAYANDLAISKSKDNFYLFDKLDAPNAPAASDKSLTRQNKPLRQRRANFFFNILDPDKKLLEVDFENIPISSIIYDIGSELQIDVFIASPLENAGFATVKAKNITFDDLLSKIFQSNTSNTAVAKNTSQLHNDSQGIIIPSAGADGYTFMIKDNIYYFGTKSQLTVRNIKSITMLHRSIELLGDPSISERSVGRTQTNFTSYNNYNSANNSQQFANPNNQSQSQSQSQSDTQIESILTIIPDEVKKDLDIKVDKELNSFIVNGPAENINRFESFVKYIDKAIPVILIEVMLLEVNKSAVIETGISAGIGTAPKTTTGTIFPTADITLGAQTINKIINNFDGFGSLNLGAVVPNFYLSLKALETNGNIKIRSSPRLSTLNGHKAHLSIGETTYYVVTSQNYYGSQITQTSEIKNYQPIDADLSITIRPLVSGDGQITLDIKVIQSSFNGERIDKDAPPGINSREFTSIVRVKDKDLIVLGGLEETVKNDSGSGVPLLSRIPIIKWLFSSRKREDSRKKLTVIIKPTVIY